MQQHGSKYFARRSPAPTTLGDGVKSLYSTILEHGHVAYQTKENHKFSNMVANNLPADPPAPQPWGIGSKGHNLTFSEHGHVAYKIKGNHEHQHGSKYFARRPTPHAPIPALGMGSIGQNLTFSDHGHVAYQIKWDHKK